MPTYNDPNINPERRQKRGMLIIFGVIALGAVIALGYAMMGGPGDMTDYEPAAGIQSTTLPNNDTTMDNDATSDAVRDMNNNRSNDRIN